MYAYTHSCFRSQETSGQGFACPQAPRKAVLAACSPTQGFACSLFTHARLRLQRTMAQGVAFEYLCRECNIVYTDPLEKFCWAEGGRERDRCVYCHRMKKRVADALAKVPIDVKKAWKDQQPMKKQEFRNANLMAPISDIPALLKVFVEEVRRCVMICQGAPLPAIMHVFINIHMYTVHVTVMAVRRGLRGVLEVCAFAGRSLAGRGRLDRKIQTQARTIGINAKECRADVEPDEIRHSLLGPRHQDNQREWLELAEEDAHRDEPRGQAAAEAA